MYQRIWHCNETPKDRQRRRSQELLRKGQPIVLSDLIVAADQQEVQAGPYDRLRIWKVRHAADFTRHGYQACTP